MGRLSRFVIGVVTAFVLSCIILGVAYATGLLAGDHTYVFELPIKLSAPFAVIVGMVAAVYPNRQDTRKHNAFAVAALGAAIGCLYWYLSERVMMAIIYSGYWNWGFRSLDYELQAASCWVAAGASAMLTAVIRQTRPVLVATAILSSLAVILPAPLFNKLTNNQELTVALVTPVNLVASRTNPYQVIHTGSREFDVPKATAHVLAALRSAGIQGEYHALSLCRIGTGKKSLQIILVNAPVVSRARLPQPDAAELIYVQTPEGWNKIPAETPTLSRSVEVWGRRDRPDWLLYFSIPDASGINLGGRIESN